jgi:hypothetical protein
MTTRGFNFRQNADGSASGGTITDGAGQTYVLDSDLYTGGVKRDGFIFGWETTTLDLSARDRTPSASIDPRLAGINFHPNNGGGPAIWRLDLDSTGDHLISLAAGDDAAGQALDITIQDGTTPFITFTAGTHTPAASQWYDATQTLRTSAANWVANNTAVTRTFTTTILRVSINATANSGGLSSTIAHIRVEAVGGGGGSTARKLSLMQMGFGR